MDLVIARNISLYFQIYGANTRSLKNKIIKSATGGVLARNFNNGIYVKALDDISFVFSEGDRVGIIGNNGSGKSSLLRVISGIYELSSGSIEVNGNIASMLSINYGMDMEATGIEYIFTRGIISGLKRNLIKKYIDEISSFAEIDDYLYMPLRVYSSGMLMRLAFATSTAFEKDILLMDEWLSVGDSDFINKAKIRLSNIINRSKLFVLVSHDHQMIKEQCNKILRLEHGKLSCINKFDI